jgi:hypothetical protein
VNDPPPAKVGNVPDRLIVERAAYLPEGQISGQHTFDVAESLTLSVAEWTGVGGLDPPENVRVGSGNVTDAGNETTSSFELEHR